MGIDAATIGEMDAPRSRAESYQVLLPVFGGVVGYFAETVHRRAGVWSRASQGAMPLWIAFAYGLALFVLPDGLRRFERRYPGAVVPNRRQRALEFLVLVGLFLAPPPFYRHELLLTLVAVGWLVARLSVSRSAGDLLLMS